MKVKADSASRNRRKQGKVTKVTQSYYQLDDNLRVHHMNVMKCKDQKPRRQTISTVKVIRQAREPKLQEEPRRQTVSTLVEAHEEEVTQEMQTDNVMNDDDARDIVYNLKILPAKFVH